MRALFFFFLLFSVFNTNAYINADILDESEFIKENGKGDIQNLLNYMNMYYKNKNCCNEQNHHHLRLYLHRPRPAHYSRSI